MTDFIRYALLTNLYWFSLPFIGYVLLHTSKCMRRFPRFLRDTANVILGQHPIIVFVASFAVTAFIFSVISVFFYLFRLPVLPIVIIYLLFAIYSTGYVVRLFINGQFSIKGLFAVSGMSFAVKLAYLLFIFAVGSNFAIYAYEGAVLGGNGDTMYHLARLVDILAGGFNIQSSYYHNLPDSSYHYNVIYALYVIPSKLFGILPVYVWRYSLGFFNLMSLLASFSFALFVFKKWIKAKEFALPLALVSIFPVMAFYSFWAYIGNYPDRIVKIWIILLVMCLFKKIDKSNFKSGLFMLLALALVLTMTHSIYSMAFALFISLFALSRLIIERKDFISDKLSILAYTVTITVLMIGPLITKLTPSRMSSESAENAQLTEHIHIFGITILDPKIYFSDDLVIWVIDILGIVAIIYLISILRKRKYDLSLALSLIFFYAFFAFTPICALLNIFVPLWVIVRFEDLSLIITQVYFTIGLYGLFVVIYGMISRNYSKLLKNRNFKMLFCAVLVMAVIAPCIAYINNYYKYVFSTNNTARYKDLDAFVNDYKDILNDNKLVISNYGYWLNSIFRVDILNVPFPHGVNASDDHSRYKCLNYIINNYNYADLKAVGADYVVEIDENKAMDVLDKKPYLKLIRSKRENFFSADSKIYVYEVLDVAKYEGGKVYQPCLDYQLNEKS